MSVENLENSEKTETAAAGQNDPEIEYLGKINDVPTIRIPKRNPDLKTAGLKNAREIGKIPLDIKQIIERVEMAAGNNEFKIFYPHFVFIDDNTKIKLIELGFKCYLGEWDGIIKDAFIIEW